jgi:hypothetical protein
MPSTVEQKGVTPEQFSRAMANLSRVAPAEMDRRLERVARDKVLPKAKSKTKKGKTGKLAGGLTVVGTAAGPTFKNPTAYANVQYWGGHTWYARSRRGRWPSPQPPGKGIGNHPTIYTVLKNDKSITDAIGKELADMMAEHFRPRNHG